VADLERTLSRGAHPSRDRCSGEGTTWLSAALLITRHIATEPPSLPSRLEPADRQTALQVLKGPEGKQLASGRGLFHRFPRMATDSRSAWLHKSSRVVSNSEGGDPAGQKGK
jgi:hypothetical protein